MSLFQSNLRKQIRNLPKILNFVKIIHYYSKLFTGVLRLHPSPRCHGGPAARAGEQQGPRLQNQGPQQGPADRGVQVHSGSDKARVRNDVRQLIFLFVLVARIRDTTRLINAFARFSLQVQCIRKVWFRRLSSETTKVELADRIVALDV